MAARKPQQTELIAIYRLEFYKKQNNWKLSSDARNEKELCNSCPSSPAKNSNILNETYSIETNLDINTSILNDAFLGDESDKDLPVCSTISRNLHIQSLEPINACQECQHTNVRVQNPWADYVDDQWIGDSEQVENCGGDGNDFEGFDGCVDGLVWINSRVAHLGCTGDVPGQPLTWAEAELGARPPWPDDQMWVPDIWEEGALGQSLESADEFMMGAHCAPHSSEVEFSVPPELSGEVEGELSLVPGAALAAGVLRHTGALRRLLREARRRRLSNHLSAPSLDQFGLGARDFFSADCSYEAVPTRDVPCPPLAPTTQHNHFNSVPTINLSQNTPMSSTVQDVPLCEGTIRCRDDFTTPSPTNLYRDGFLAGSYRNRAITSFMERGRGRGRLVEETGVGSSAGRVC